MTLRAKHISISINRTAADVYAFASNPENLPKWAAGLCGSIKRIGGDWIASSPMGDAKVKFADGNPFGVLDHEVTLESGEKFYNPMRVFRNQGGCEVVFTLFRQSAMSDRQYADDEQAILRDLDKLKKILEK